MIGFLLGYLLGRDSHPRPVRRARPATAQDIRVMRVVALVVVVCLALVLLFA